MLKQINNRIRTSRVRSHFGQVQQLGLPRYSRYGEDAGVKYRLGMMPLLFFLVRYSFRSLSQWFMYLKFSMRCWSIAPERINCFHRNVEGKSIDWERGSSCRPQNLMQSWWDGVENGARNIDRGEIRAS